MTIVSWAEVTSLTVIGQDRNKINQSINNLKYNSMMQLQMFMVWIVKICGLGLVLDG